MQRVRAVLDALHIPLFGVCSFVPLRPHLLPCRAAERLPKTPRSVIVCLFPYRVDSDLPRNLSRYACVPDYHRVVGSALWQAAEKLSPLLSAEVVPFVDNSPIPEVYAAALAGLGCIGDNGLLITPRYGSYVFIGTLVTDAALSAPRTGIQRCPGCGACRRQCPAGALTESGIDRSRCLSAVSQRKGKLAAEEEAALIKNGLIWGCDRCQEVCPLNREAVCEPFVGFDTYEPWLDTVPAKAILKEKPYGWRGAAVLERNRKLFLK